MNYKRIAKIPKYITRSFFELPCVFSADKVPGTNYVFYVLNEVRNRINGTHRHAVTEESRGALAEDYKGQWWYLTKEEFEEYVEECGLARESQMP